MFLETEGDMALVKTAPLKIFRQKPQVALTDFREPHTVITFKSRWRYSVITLPAT
jgi:hypothetical protein